MLNFEAAIEMLEVESVPVAFVRTTGDVASAPPDRKSERRGVAGSFFVLKIAAARAEEGAGLVEVTETAKRANLSVRSMALTLSSCTIPASGQPIFHLGKTRSPSVWEVMGSLASMMVLCVARRNSRNLW